MDRQQDLLLRELRAIATRTGVICNQLATPARNGRDPCRLIQAAFARLLVRSRAELRSLLGDEIVSGPGFDLLLDLYATEADGQVASYEEGTALAGVTASTATRWVGILESQGMVERIPGPTDRSASILRLSSSTRVLLERWLDRTTPVSIDGR